MSRLLLFQAGLAAAFIQGVAVGTVTFGMFLAAQHGLIVPASPDLVANVASKMDQLLPLLRWTYLLIAWE